MPQQVPEILQLRNITKSFGDVKAVRDISEIFYQGEYVCILGPSGCGKSTLLRLIAGFEEPEAGEIILDGKNLRNVGPERRSVNMVFQNYALFPHMTVFENVAFGLRMKKHSRDRIQKEADEALQLVNLKSQADRYPRQLSGGQQQRVALARAIVNHPQILLLDEPLAALDKNLRLAMQDELRRIQREVGITFLHVTHDQSEALIMADRLAIMNEGKFIQVGPPQEVYNHPRNRFAAEFLGFSNILKGNWFAGNPPEIRLENNITLQLEEHQPLEQNFAGEFLIRPEKIELYEEAPPLSINVLEGTLSRIRYAGPDLECDVNIGGLTLLLQALGRGTTEKLREGQKVFIHIASKDIVFLPDHQAEVTKA